LTYLPELGMACNIKTGQDVHQLHQVVHGGVPEDRFAVAYLERVEATSIEVARRILWVFITLP
jgi:hypothetical protein